MKILTVSVIGMSLLISGCCPEAGKQEVKDEPSAVMLLPETNVGDVIADTIIYDVIIKNTNPEDTWTDECLKNLKKDQFIDNLFQQVYSENSVAYDLMNDKIISPDELKVMEKKNEISRDKIGKIQFVESWIYNDSVMSMTKKVLSVSLGIEVFDERGELLGYKHAFKIYFN